jgi:hydroxyacylglutathione hydrolase
MYVEQLYTKCLAEAAYYIESNGEAAIIDPLRETEPYLALAEARGAKIKYIFETHFHADFVSGHIDLAKQSGGKIVYGPTAVAGYDIYQGKDMEVFPLGDVSITLLHTPGHTMESSCFLLKDEEGKDHGVFTGDTLFVGDVGRPDLAVKSGEITQEDLAGFLYDSIHSKLMPLADEVIVYPGHGAGSACGKNLGSETTSTIGEQKAQNYALKPMSKEQFIAEVTEGLLAPPSYFFKDAMMNKNGYDSIEEVMQNNTTALSAEELKQAVKEGALVLDTRAAGAFAKGHIDGAMNIGLQGQYAPWVGGLIAGDRKLVLVADEGREDEAVMRLARIGYENVVGYLNGGISSWTEELATITDVTTAEGGAIIREGAQIILDVRKPGEVNAGHVEGSVNIRLQELPGRLNELDKDKAIAVYCAGGYRSMIACSVLRANGFHQLTNIQGGFGQLQTEDIPLVEGVSCSNS